MGSYFAEGVAMRFAWSGFPSSKEGLFGTIMESNASPNKNQEMVPLGSRPKALSGR